MTPTQLARLRQLVDAATPDLVECSRLENDPVTIAGGPHACDVAEFWSDDDALGAVPAVERDANVALFIAARPVLLQLLAERDEVLAALREVVAISDRKHNAWDRAHAAMAKAEALAGGLKLEGGL